MQQWYNWLHEMNKKDEKTKKQESFFNHLYHFFNRFLLSITFGSHSFCWLVLYRVFVVFVSCVCVVFVCFDMSLFLVSAFSLEEEEKVFVFSAWRRFVFKVFVVFVCGFCFCVGFECCCRCLQK